MLKVGLLLKIWSKRSTWSENRKITSCLLPVAPSSDKSVIGALAVADWNYLRSWVRILLTNGRLSNDYCNKLGTFFLSDQVQTQDRWLLIRMRWPLSYAAWVIIWKDLPRDSSRFASDLLTDLIARLSLEFPIEMVLKRPGLDEEELGISLLLSQCWETDYRRCYWWIF